MKTILHLCADLGSDSYPYQCDSDYRVIRIGKEYGVENLTKETLLRDFGVSEVHGIIANPVCTDLSRARQGGKPKSIENGMFLVNQCLRIIDELKPKWWALENPASSALRQVLGKPRLVYQPWEYGSPWTKRTALWGNFNIPEKKYTDFEDVPNKLESNNDVQLAMYWSSLADIFCLDAFDSSHRKHASTFGVAKYIPNLVKTTKT